MRAWPCRCVSGVATVLRPGTLPGEERLPAPGGFLAVAVGQYRHDCRSAAPYPLRGRLSALRPLPGSDPGPVLPGTGAVRFRLGQRPAIAPLVHHVGHRHPTPAVVSGAVGILHLGAPGFSLVNGQPIWSVAHRVPQGSAPGRPAPLVSAGQYQTSGLLSPVNCWGP